MEFDGYNSSKEIKLPLSVIILTLNEEKNIEDCIKSIDDWAKDIFVVDSYSTDRTLEIARRYTDKIYQHRFEDYGKQRNWAQDTLPINGEWVFHLDADERVTPELEEELRKIFLDSDIQADGFLISRRTIFMDKWIKYGGHYPVYHLRVFKKSKGRCENRGYHQHFITHGKTLKLKGDIIDIIASDLTTMIDRHNKWADSEAKELLCDKNRDQIIPKFFGTPIERRRWLRRKIYKNLPLFLRSFLYFFYRYFIRLGFLDGKEGLIFHFLQGFWAQFLIDAKVYEYRKKTKNKKS